MKTIKAELELLKKRIGPSLGTKVVILEEGEDYPNNDDPDTLYIRVVTDTREKEVEVFESDESKEVRLARMGWS